MLCSRARRHSYWIGGRTGQLINPYTTRTKVQPACKRICDIGLANYNQLTFDQKLWFTIKPLTLGGIIDHYVNPQGNITTTRLKFLECLGFHDLAEQTQKVNKLFTNGQAPTDITERNEQWDSWCEEHEELLEEVDAYS